MGRVLKALRRVRMSLDAEPVHRLRVALRRCRSLAVLMEEVDPHPAWTDVKRLSRKLFKALGALRDTQVLENWVKKLTPADDNVRAALITVLENREIEPQARVRRAVKQFDRQAWRRLARALERRARVVPPNGLAAQCLALERYEELHRLHMRAMRTERPTPWHGLRVSVKRFRYAVESLLPARLAVWEEGLGAVFGKILDGPLLAPVNQELATRVRVLLQRSERRIVLDLSSVSLIDAAGVGVLVRAYNVACAMDASLRIAHATKRVRETLERVGLFDLLSSDD
jgi:anti-anti-sigma factor